MCKIIISIFLVFTFLCSTAMGEILTIKHTVKQTFGGGQSPDDAQISAIAKAKMEALEKAGTYIESLTIVKNSQVEKDEIIALTAGVLKAEVVSQKNYHTDDAFGIEIVVNVVVDTSVLEERVKKQLQDRTHLKQLKETQKREKELLQKVDQLEEENRKLSAKNQSTKQLKREFQQASLGLTAMDLLNKANALWNIDLKKAIEYLNNAIHIDPDSAVAYNNRGNAYFQIGQQQRAIEDYNEAIRLYPGYAEAYNNRGTAYFQIGQQQRAIEDSNEAIRLNPEFAYAYNNRGNAYSKIGQQQRAIEDYNEAIRLYPGLAAPYIGRGTAYFQIGQQQRAIEDNSEAIRLNPSQPFLALAYEGRGYVYFLQGNNLLGCRDAQNACALGNCRLIEMYKSRVDCR